MQMIKEDITETDAWQGPCRMNIVSLKLAWVFHRLFRHARSRQVTIHTGHKRDLRQPHSEDPEVPSCARQA